MKTLKLMAALFVVSILAAGTKVRAEEKTKEYNESWPVASVSSLDITNRFGEIRINNEGGSEVTIDVIITVEAANEQRTNDLLNKIDVLFRKDGSTVIAQTKIGNDFKSQKNFSIDYVVNVPSDKNLKIVNKYGNTVIGKLTANGDFNIKYGDFTAYELDTPKEGSLVLDLSYGDGNIGSASFMDAKISYSPITIEAVKKLTIESRYSTINVAEAGDIKSASRFDKYSCDSVSTLTADTKYTHIAIAKLEKKLKIEAGYGSIRVDKVSSDFESIDITNSYGQISLGLDDANYSVDASCNYCGILYPEDEFSGDKVNENNARMLKGIIRSGEGGKVTVRSSYGEIKLKD